MKKSIIDIINRFNNEKESFINDIKCVFCKLNENSVKRVSIDDIDINDLFSIYIEKEIISIVNKDTNLEKAKNIKEIIFTLTLAIISLSPSLLVGFDIYKNSILSPKNSLIMFLISLIPVIIIAIILIIIIYKIMIKDIVNDENIIINDNNMLKDYHLIQFIYEKFYKKNRKE